MDLEKIEEALLRFIELMNANEVTELEVEDGDARFRIKKGGEPASPPPTFVTTMEAGAGETSELAAIDQPAAGGPEPSGLVEIPSPLVGTYYRSPAPDAASFVEVGDEVDTDTVLCIVEAMKVMNEIKSEIEGRIVEILVENGQPVEFGQPLFIIEPSQ